MTEGGATGIAFTYREGGGGCPRPENYRDYEGESAAELLKLLKSPSPLDRSMALALINSLNHETASGLAEGDSDAGWMDDLGIGSGSRVAMVGLFLPLLKILRHRGAEVVVIERSAHHRGAGISGLTGSCTAARNRFSTTNSPSGRKC